MRLQETGDTVRVQILPTDDTLSVRIVSGTTATELADTTTVRTITPIWPALADLTLATTLITVTVWMHLKNNRLTRSLAEAERKAETQREIERQEANKQRLQAEQDNAHLRVSALAYELERQIGSWIDEVPAAAGMNVFDAIKHRKVDRGVAHTKAFQWAKTRASSTHSDPAQDRILTLVLQAAQAAEEVIDAVNAAYVEFHEAMTRMNRSLSTGEPNELLQLASEAYTKLRSCREKLQKCFHPLHKRQFIQMAGVAVSGSSGHARLDATPGPGQVAQERSSEE